MQKIVLTFGLIAGALLTAMMALAMVFHDQIGFDRGLIVGYTSMVLAFLMIYFGVRSYRDNVAAGQVTFGRACQVGVLIMLVASLCYVASWEVMYQNFMSDYLDKYAAHALEKARNAGATDAQLALQASEMAEFKVMYQNPLVRAAFTLLEPLPVGILFTLLSAWLLSRKRKQEPAASVG